MLIFWPSCLPYKGEEAFLVAEQEAGNGEGDSWMEIEYAIFFHLAKSCPWAVPGLIFFPVFPSLLYLALLPPFHFFQKITFKIDFHFYKQI